MKRSKLIILALPLIILGCNSYVTSTEKEIKATPAKVTLKSDTSPIPSVSSVPESSLVSEKFESFPEPSSNPSLEDKYDLQDYVEKNNVLGSIPVSQVDGYRVRFTSDGGAVFSIKASDEDSEFIWKRKPQKLLFDTFQLTNIVQSTAGPRYYARYSQLIDNDIIVNKTGQSEINKKAQLVQTVGLNLARQGENYKIIGLTPVVIRQIEKKSLPYKIDKITLKEENGNELSIDNDKAIIPWPGINVKTDKSQKFKLNVLVSKDVSVSTMAVLVGIQGEQFQLSKISEGNYSGDIGLSFKDNKSSLMIELIDKSSLGEKSKYHGYTWIIPFIKK